MKRGTIDHPKMDELCAELNVPRYAAVGILNTLWDWASRYVPRGDIGKYSDRVIAKKIEWEGEPDALISGLVRSKWIDISQEHRLVIHDWPEHCEDSTHAQLARQATFFADGSMPKLTKLNEKERSEANKRFAENNCAVQRMAAQYGAQNPPALPFQAKPQPEPSQGEGAAGAAPLPAPEETPAQLTPALCAGHLIRDLKLVEDPQLHFAVMQSVKLVAEIESVQLGDAAERIFVRARDALDRKVLVNRFWFTDGKWREGAGGSNQQSGNAIRSGNNKQALRDAVERRGVEVPADTPRANGGPVPTPGFVDRDGGIPPRLRGPGDPLQPPPGHEIPGRVESPPRPEILSPAK